MFWDSRLRQRYKYHQDPIEGWRECKHHGSRTSPLNMAAFHGRVTFASLLIEHGADPNLATDDTGWSPLFTAISQTQTSMVRLLLNKGADHNMQIPTEDTALSSAVGCQYPFPGPENKRLPMVELLIRHGADPNVPTRGQGVLACARFLRFEQIEALLGPQVLNE
jgi:ankyrin repeat protein